MEQPLLGSFVVFALLLFVTYLCTSVYNNKVWGNGGSVNMNAKDKGWRETHPNHLILLDDRE